MTKEEKEKILMEEIDKKYSEHFKKEMKMEFKDEDESNEFCDKFHKDLREFLKRRKKELGLESTQE